LFSDAQSEIEGCTVVQFPLRPDSATVFLNDPLHGRQTDAGALEVLGAMQALEDSKQFVDILHVEADAIVPNH